MRHGTLRRTTLLLPLLLALGLVACGVDAPPDTAAPDGTATVDDRRVLVEGRDLLLEADGQRRTLATVDPDRDGRLEHATLRPGAHPADTVLVLTRAEDRYELRYLVVDDGEASDLYWFPWRLQVDEDHLAHHDVAPHPVWSPDGAALAWLEWSGAGTRLRTVAWMADEVANNPSDDSDTYRLAGVPVGTQLERWEDGGTAPTLVGSDGEVTWRIELRPEAGAVAMELHDRE